MQNNTVYKLTEAQKCTDGGTNVMNENKHTAHIALIGQAAEQIGQRRPMNPVISQLTQRPPKQFMADINQYMKEHSMLKQIHTAEYADTSRMKPDFSSVELQTLELCKEGQSGYDFMNIIVAGTQQRSRSEQVARQLETLPLSHEAINIYANNAYKARIRLDYIRRHDIEYFRPLLNKELSSVILSCPFTSFARHNAIQNYLKQRQINKENNAVLPQMFRDELIKSGFARYGLSNLQFKGLYQGFNSTSVDAAIIETVQSVQDTMKNSGYKEA